MTINKQTLIKYGIWAAIALIITIIAIVIINKTKTKIQNKLTKKQQEQINNLEIDETDLTVAPTIVQNLVAKLKAAFGKYGYATDEEAIYLVFEQLETRSDLLNLINAFGVYNGHTLSEWMNKELNTKELAHVQEILSAKGIVYTF